MIEQPAPPDRPAEPVPVPDVVHHEDRFQTSFYRHAEYYSQVAEQNHSVRLAWFLRKCFDDFSPLQPRSGLELGCGPALLSCDLAGQGLALSALDISPEMVRVAGDSARARGVELRPFVGNLIRYELDEPVDLVTNLGLNSSHMLTNDEMLAHLACVAASLNPGGLYFVELEFVAFGDRAVFRAYEPPWIVYDTAPALYAARGFAGGQRITFLWGGPEARYDPIRQVFRSTNSIVLERGAEREVIERSSVGKVFLPLEFRCLVQLTPGLEFVQWYRDYAPSATFAGHPDADRFVAVLRRTP